MSFPRSPSPEFYQPPTRPIDRLADEYIEAPPIDRLAERGFEAVAAYAISQLNAGLTAYERNYEFTRNDTLSVDHLADWVGLWSGYDRTGNAEVVTGPAIKARMDEIMRAIKAPLPQVYRGFARQLLILGHHLVDVPYFNHNGIPTPPHTTDMAYYVGVTEALKTDRLPWDAGMNGQKEQLQGIINAEVAKMTRELVAAGKPYLALSLGRSMTSKHTGGKDQASHAFAGQMAWAVHHANPERTWEIHEDIQKVLPAASNVGKQYRSHFAK